MRECLVLTTQVFQVSDKIDGQFATAHGLLTIVIQTEQGNTVLVKDSAQYTHIHTHTHTHTHTQYIHTQHITWHTRHIHTLTSVT